jgi:hypothetical protein
MDGNKDVLIFSMRGGDEEVVRRMERRRDLIDFTTG